MKFVVSIILLIANVSLLFPRVSFSPANYQNDMLAYVRSLVPANPVILEAGGHFGEDTIRMKAMWPHATMHVFEPLPLSFEKMVAATHELSNVFCYPYALTSFSGSVNFYINPNNSGASSIGRPVEWNKNEFEETPIQVQCITINEWARLNNVSKIDFMWLDMEGHELYALQHASDILSTVKAIFTEISFVPVREGSCSYTKLKLFLEAEGFVEAWKSCATGRYGDALFIRI